MIRAYVLATTYGLPAAYDAPCLVVAERLGCPLWTFDKLLFNLVREKLAWVHYAPDFRLPSPHDK